MKTIHSEIDTEQKVKHSTKSVFACKVYPLFERLC